MVRQYVIWIVLHTGWETTYEHTGIIQQHYLYLIERLEVKGGLLDHLLSANVLKQPEWELVNAEMTATTQTEKLLSVLSRKTRDQFNKFLEALDTTGQQHVHSHITGQQRMSRCLCRGCFHRQLTALSPAECTGTVKKPDRSESL